jgi:nitrate/nitrite transporter NarK
MSAEFSFSFATDPEVNDYWNTVLYWPIKLAVIFTLLLATWKSWNKESTIYGLAKRPPTWRPYLLMLFIMIPLIAAASTQQDFLSVYPKLKHVDAVPHESYRWIYSLLYEVCYGLDFVGIELFFRGFLIIGFARWAGKHAILPMAVFYCTIHFGKPLGECISSFFGGLILGVVTYHSRTIWGGLMVHLGIAWLMELGGYIGNRF